MHKNNNKVTKCGFKANSFLFEETFKVLDHIHYFVLILDFILIVCSLIEKKTITHIFIQKIYTEHKILKCKLCISSHLYFDGISTTKTNLLYTCTQCVKTYL